MMINDLELLIYNAEVKLLFVRDEELSLLDEVASGSGKEGEREEDR